MHMQCGPTQKAFRLAAWRSHGQVGGIHISPYVAHSWVQTGTGAKMQKRPYLYSSRLSLGSRWGWGAGGGARLLLEFLSQQTNKERWVGHARGQWLAD